MTVFGQVTHVGHPVVPAGPETGLLGLTEGCALALSLPVPLLRTSFPQTFVWLNLRPHPGVCTHVTSSHRTPLVHGSNNSIVTLHGHPYSPFPAWFFAER